MVFLVKNQKGTKVHAALQQDLREAFPVACKDSGLSSVGSLEKSSAMVKLGGLRGPAPIGRRAEPIPWLPLAVAAFGLAGMLNDPCSDALTLDRDSLAGVRWAALLGAHFVHWGWPHFLADLAWLVLLAALAGARRPGAAWVLGGALACSGLVLGWLDDITRYRGSSALAAIYLPYALATLWHGHGRERALALLLGMAFGLRIAADAAGWHGPPVLPTGVRSVWELHLLGCAWGWAGLGLKRLRPAHCSRPSSPSS